MSKADIIRDMMNTDNPLHVSSVMGAGTAEGVLAQRSLTRLAWRARNIFTLLSDTDIKGTVAIARLGTDAREGNMEITVTNPDAANLPSIFRSFRMVVRVGMTGKPVAEYARIYVGHDASPLTVELDNHENLFAKNLYAAVASIVGQMKWSSLPEVFPNLRVQAQRLQFDKYGYRGFSADFHGAESGWTYARFADNNIMTIHQHTRNNGWVAAEGAFTSFLTQKFREDFGGNTSEVLEYFYNEVSTVTNKMVFRLSNW